MGSLSRTDTELPSWRPGPARDAIETFVKAARDVPKSHRIAVFDNDGTLWCEKPLYVQQAFLGFELADAVRAKPELASRPEYRALIEHDEKAQADLGLPRIAEALLELNAGATPEEFEQRVGEFMASQRHPDRDVPYAQTVYRPMLELMETLRHNDFQVFVVTGGGTEFVRAVSGELYDVPPSDVIGTLIEYEYSEGPVLRRTAKPLGDVNEGPPKVKNIQAMVGRRPIFAAGNSGGDRAMLDYVTAGPGPSMAMLIDHDDSEREYAYESRSVTLGEQESIVETGRQADWTVVSMREDWSTIYG
jgi:phosphoserine phosphatase